MKYALLVLGVWHEILVCGGQGRDEAELSATVLHNTDNPQRRSQLR